MPIREGVCDKVFIVTSGRTWHYAQPTLHAVKAFEARNTVVQVLYPQNQYKGREMKAEELAWDMGIDIAP